MSENKHKKTKKHLENEQCEKDQTNVESKETKDVKTEESLENYKDLLLRTQADFENYRKRSLKEKEDFLKYANLELLKDVLPIVDNFERAMAVEANADTKAFLDGFQMVFAQLKDLLTKFGVSEINSVGQVFNPNLHQAIQSDESADAEEETVSEVFQKGYLLKDKILRLAMVKVSRPKKN